MAKYVAATPRTYSGPKKLVQTGPFTIERRGSISEPGLVVTVNTIGVPQVMRALKNWNRQMKLAAERGVKKACKFLLDETLKVTPVKTGNLKKSGNYFVKKAGELTVGVVYFNDHIAPYAIYVHEDLTKYHRPPTIAKFLQRTQWKNRGQISRIIREEIQKARPQ